MTEALTADHFVPHLNKVFQIAGAPIELVLARVDQRTLESWEVAEGLREPFSLIFHGPADLILSEGLLTLTHQANAFELYLMPIHTPRRDHQAYQAVFN